MEIVQEGSPERFGSQFSGVEKLATDLFEWRFETSGARPVPESAGELPNEVSNWVEENLGTSINRES